MRETITCPHCRGGQMYLVEDKDGTFRCQNCGEKTHRKIEEHRDAIQDLAESDLPIADVCETLLGKGAER